MRLLKLLTRLPLAIPLLPLLYALQTARREYGAVRAGEVAVFVLVYLLPAAWLWSLVAIRRKKTTAFIAMLAMALLLYWELWARQPWLVAHMPFFTVSVAPIGLAGVLALALRWLFIKCSADAQGRVLLILNSTVVVSVLTEAALLAAMHRPPEPAFTKQDQDATQFAADRLASGPNVYLVVFDEYASTAALREDWGFDNSAMDAFLQAQGFWIQDSSQSNYPETYPSMASFLNLDYLPATKGNIVRMPEYHDYNRWIEQSRLIRIFQEQGYRFINNSIFSIRGQGTRNADPFYASGAKLLNANTFAAYLVREYWPAITHGAAREGYLAAVDSTILEHHRYNEQALATLDRHLQQPGDSPTLIYTHLLLPHNPYFFDSTGTLMDMDAVREATMSNDPQAYLNSLRQANRAIRDLIPRILEAEHQQAIIVLMGDHGYRNTSKPRRADAHFRNLSAVYFPRRSCEWLSPSTTNVNLARHLYRRAFGKYLELLPDSIVHILERP